MTEEGKQEALRLELVERIERYAPHDGHFPMRLPGLSLFRYERPSQELNYGIQTPGLCLIAQGSKVVLLDRETYRNDERTMMVYSMDLPVGSCVARSSDDKPYLSLRLDLDVMRLAELLPRVHPYGTARPQEERAVAVAPVDPGILEAAVRLMARMDSASDAQLLAPLLVDEILIRLLRGLLGQRVAQMGQEDSRLHRVGKAVTWLRTHFAEPMDVEELASTVGMSLTTFHQHFKSVTGMSPLQFQKTLRLQEARRLLLSSETDAGIAARKVGYASPSQFSREYGRHFGTSPLKDVARLRMTVGSEVPVEV